MMKTDRTEVAHMTNSLMIIEPYWHNGTWVFDDKSVGLDKEPFVAGTPNMIDDLVSEIPDARNGFRLLFSAAPFPGYRLKVIWVRAEDGGDWYRIDGRTDEGWLCPALFKYFETAPEAIYVGAEPAGGKATYDPNEVAFLRNRVEELERTVYRLTMENEFLKSAGTPPPPEPSAGNYWDSSV